MIKNPADIARIEAAIAHGSALHHALAERYGTIDSEYARLEEAYYDAQEQHGIQSPEAAAALVPMWELDVLRPAIAEKMRETLATVYRNRALLGDDSF